MGWTMATLYFNFKCPRDVKVELRDNQMPGESELEETSNTFIMAPAENILMLQECEALAPVKII